MPAYNYTTLADPLQTDLMTQANGINNAGQIVGQYHNSSGYHGFLYSAGTYTPIDGNSAGSPPIRRLCRARSPTSPSIRSCKRWRGLTAAAARRRHGTATAADDAAAGMRPSSYVIELRDSRPSKRPLGSLAERPLR